MKLELKHLAPYMPYKLYCQTLDKKEGHLTKKELIEISQNKVKVELMKGFPLRVLKFNEIKPILRPLSDLTKEEYINLFYENPLDYKVDELPYKKFTKLLELHFDVFHLIPQGLAVDINTI